MVSLLDHDECDPWFVVRLQLDAGLSDGGELVLQDVGELALAHPVPVHDDPVGLVATSALVEHDQVLLDHGAQLVDDLLPMLLDTNGGCVSARVRVLASHHCRDAWLLVIT